MKQFLHIYLLLSLLSVHNALSNESGAFRPTWAELVRENGKIIKYEGYYVLYDEARRIPRYVAYCLMAEEVVDGPRPSGFHFQQDVDCGMNQADFYDYKGSGWSRGHMAPAADFKWSLKAYGDTFYYTNCCPQNQSMNNGSWNVLENHVRRLARKYAQIYVVTGPVVGSNRFGTIGHNKVVVPDGFFKALLVCVEGKYHAIGFYMQNISDKQFMKDCYITIDKLETISGIDFFPSLDDDVEKAVEAEVNTSIWF